jgi:hypothetical protein
MWKKQDDAAGQQPDLASNDTPDLASLGDALVQSLMNDQFRQGSFPAAPPNAQAEDHGAPVPLPSMKSYAEATNEFTSHASALIEHLPLLAKARVAYEEALRASAEMRKVLDAGDERLRTLMSQLEQGISVHGLKPVPDRKNSEPAKVERMKTVAEAGSRAIRWP